MGKKIINIIILTYLSILFTACELKNSEMTPASARDWKTYTSNEYEFEIKYPSDWLISYNYSSNASFTLFILPKNNYISEMISLDVIKNKKEMIDYFGEVHIRESQITDIIVSGQSGKKIQYLNWPADGSPATEITAYVQKGEFTYFLTYTYGGEPNDYGNARFNEIISTFKIII